MTKNYYKEEYTNEELVRLIDKAISYGCGISYSPSGRIITIDSTKTENDLIWYGRCEDKREFWANFIHDNIERYARTGDVA